jgi:hypothetical protein
MIVSLDVSRTKDGEWTVRVRLAVVSTFWKWLIL